KQVRGYLGPLQLQLEVVEVDAWLTVVGDVCFIRLVRASDVCRPEHLTPVRTEIRKEVVAAHSGSLSAQTVAVVDEQQVTPESILHAASDGEVCLGLRVGWRRDPAAARDEVGCGRTAGRQWRR